MQRQTIASLLFIGKLFFSAAVVLPYFSSQALAQQDAASQPVELGIIVTSTETEAAGVLRKLNAGWDFSVLAKEKSIDPTAIDGGYMGKLSPSQLRSELRDALAGHSNGQISGIVPVPVSYTHLDVYKRQYNDCFFKQVALKSGDRVLDEA